jgi:hypothetical protein
MEETIENEKYIRPEIVWIQVQRILVEAHETKSDGPEISI